MDQSGHSSCEWGERRTQPEQRFSQRQQRFQSCLCHNIVSQLRNRKKTEWGQQKPSTHHDLQSHGVGLRVSGAQFWLFECPTEMNLDPSGNLSLQHPHGPGQQGSPLSSPAVIWAGDLCQHVTSGSQAGGLQHPQTSRPLNAAWLDCLAFGWLLYWHCAANRLSEPCSLNDFQGSRNESTQEVIN